MADTLYTFDPVPANNTSLDAIPYGPNQLYHNQIDNWFRSLASKIAQFVDDLGAVNSVSGTDTVVVTLASGIAAYATGQMFRFIAAATNTGAATVNVNSIGAKAIRKISGGTDVALVAGDIVAGETYAVIYRASANAAAGAWVIVGGTGLFLPLAGGTLTGDLTVSKATPQLILNAPSGGTHKNLRGRVNGLDRWYLGLGNATAEGGANAGSDFELGAYDDAGAYLYSPLTVTRSTGAVNLNRGQLVFPASQNASTNANTLDDYEEGAWTPDLRFGGGATGITYAFRVGRYVKTGKWVTASGLFVLTSKGVNTLTATVEGLPFTAATLANMTWWGSLGWFNTATGVTWAGCAVATGTTTLGIYILPGATASDANFGNNTNLLFSVTYEAAT